jgi:tetratricopeptide (TPR) repeat protein
MELARILALLLCLLPVGAGAIGFSGVDLEGRPCQGKVTTYGPFDYTNPQHVREKLGVVEAYHFSREVEQLVKGKSGYLLGDLNYTLGAFPNHHRALFAIIRYVTVPRQPRQGDGTLITPPECYLQRALRFQPRDGKTHMLFGLYMHRLKRYEEAEQHYRNALELMPNNAEAHYNLGLLLVDMERYEAAQAEAKTAYRLGFPLAGLRRRLAEAGHPLSP